MRAVFVKLRVLQAGTWVGLRADRAPSRGPRGKENLPTHARDGTPPQARARHSQASVRARIFRGPHGPLAFPRWFYSAIKAQ